jgi:hypothetical protein
MRLNCFPGRDINADWNDPKAISINKIRDRADLIPFPNLADCAGAISNYRRYLSSFIHVLTDNWLYRKYDEVSELPERLIFHKEDFSQTRKSGIFSATQKPLPWPLTDLRQSVHVYHQDCSLPSTWSVMRKRIAFAGVKSAFHLIVNGQICGFSEACDSLVYFDITAQLYSRTNEISLIIYESSTGSHLTAEQQDIHGIASDIFIEALPPVSLFDASVSTQAIDTSYQKWHLEIELDLQSCRLSLGKPYVEVSVEYQNKQIITKTKEVVLHPLEEDHNWGMSAKSRGRTIFSLYLDDINPWSSESPDLYDLFITIYDEHRVENASYNIPVGFREIKKEKDGIFINGKILHLDTYYYNYVNTCEAIDNYKLELRNISNDFLSIKRSGYNSVFCENGLPDTSLLDMADLIGLYVIIDADVNLQTEYYDFANEVIKEDYYQRILAKVKSTLNASKLKCSTIGWTINYDANYSDNSSTIIKLDKDTASIKIEYIDINTIPSFRGNNLQSQKKDNLYLSPLVLTSSANCENLMFHNSYLFTNISDISVNWIACNQQKIIDNGLLKLPVLSAGTTYELSIDMPGSSEPITHYNIKTEWYDTVCLPSPVKRTMFHYIEKTDSNASFLSEPPAGRFTPIGHGTLRLDLDRHLLLISGNRFWFIFNRLTGSFESWRFGETEFLSGTKSHVSGISPTIDNTILTVIKSNYACDGDSAIIESECIISCTNLESYPLYIRYEINQRAELRVFYNLEIPENNSYSIEHAIIDINLSRHLSNLEWFGWGHMTENYNSDSIKPSSSAACFMHNNSDDTNIKVNTWLMKHMHTIESSLPDFQSAHWLFASNDKGLGLLVTSDGTFSFKSSTNENHYDKNKDNSLFFLHSSHNLQLEFLSKKDINANNNFDINDSRIIIVKKQYVFSPAVLSI